MKILIGLKMFISLFTVLLEFKGLGLTVGWWWVVLIGIWTLWSAEYSQPLSVILECYSPV